jgi:hypothetical protein
LRKVFEFGSKEWVGSAGSTQSAIAEIDDENFLPDEQIEHLVQDKKAVVSRRKKSYDKANVRRSTRIKLKRNCA